MSEPHPVAAQLRRCRVVLVRPHYAGNVGSVARSMCNFGLSDLALVNPVCDFVGGEARRLSARGEGVLRSAKVVGDLGEAVADCALVVATSALTAGMYRERFSGPPDLVVPRVLDTLADAPAALVFGPEPSGLTNAEVARCHALISIPTDHDYPALNLAQAVTVCLYELRRQWLARTGQSRRPTPPADNDTQERLFEALRQGLEDVHFLYGTKAEPLMHAVRQILGRAALTGQEVQILHGLARQLRWAGGRQK